MNELAANPHAADPPAIAVPEALPLPVAIAVIGGTGDVGRAAVIAVTGSVVAVTRAIIAGAGERTADDGAADDTGGQSCAKAALGMGRGATADTARVAMAARTINDFLMALPFSVSKDSFEANCRSEVPYFT